MSFYDRFKCDAEFSASRNRDDPETRAIKNLMFAVLEQAISDWIQRGTSVRRTRMRDDAGAWMFDDGASDLRDPRSLFDFRSSCDFLGFDPEFLRERLRPRKATMALKAGGSISLIGNFRSSMAGRPDTVKVAI